MRGKKAGRISTPFHEQHSRSTRRSPARRTRRTRVGLIHEPGGHDDGADRRGPRSRGADRTPQAQRRAPTSGDANRLLTESAALKVESSNTFSRFQAKKGRMEEQGRAITFTKLFTLAPESAALREAEVKRWEGYIAKNSVAEKDVKLDEAGFPAKNEDGSENDTLGALIVLGKRLNAQAAEKAEQAVHINEESAHVHHQADGLDWAHLTVELGLVLCTVSILTKRRRSGWLASSPPSQVEPSHCPPSASSTKAIGRWLRQREGLATGAWNRPRHAPFNDFLIPRQTSGDFHL